jgi:membrane protease YdiL (CAAX protease family)
VTPTTPYPAVPPGWYPDPWGVAAWRWWDGWQWTAYAGGPVLAYSRPAPEPQYPDDDESARVACWPAVAVGFIGAFLFAAVLGAVVHVSGTALLVSLIGVWGSLGTAIALAAHRHPLPVRRLFAAPKGSHAWWAAVGTGIGGGIVLRILSGIAGSPFIHWVQEEQRNRPPIEGFHLSGRTVLVAFLVICVGAPLFEELFFRGVLLPALAQRMPVQAALVVQAALFASLHLAFRMGTATALFTLVVIGVGGYGLGFLRVRTHSLVPGILAHSTFNAIALLAAIYLVH